jgi:hypothetical protein
MVDSIEEAILRHIREKSPASLRGLYEALLAGNLLVPVFSELTRDASGRTDVPVSCIRLPNGEGCIPAFTSVARLLECRQAGSQYAELPGPTLFKMASGMPEIDCIYVNYSERQGTPKGKVARLEFDSLARGIMPEHK